MKRNWRRWFLVVLTVLFTGLTACGQGTGGSLTAVSGGAGSGLRDEVKQQRDEYSSWFANKENAYEVLETYDEKKDTDKNFLVQKKLDGTTVRRFYIKDLYQLNRVTDEWIYYCVYREDDMDDDNCRLCEVWRAPAGKETDGDHPVLEKKERLLSMYHLTDLCVLDSYIYYLGGEDGVEDGKMTLYRYDLETKRPIPVMGDKKLEEAAFVWRKQEEKGPLMLQGQLFLSDEDSLYSLKADSGEWKQIYYGEDLSFLSSGSEIERCGENIYFSPDNKQIYRYGGMAEKAERVIPKDAIQAKLEEISLWGRKGHEGEGSIYGIMVYHGRLYLTVGVSWTQRMRLKLTEAAEAEEGGAEADWRCSRTILLSAAAEFGELTYESAVSDYFAEHAKYVSQDKFNERVHNEDSSLGVLNEKEILLSCNRSRYFNAPVYAAYDPETKKIRKVAKEEAGEGY